MSEEQVLCFPRRMLDAVGTFHGARTDVARYVEMINQAPLQYLPRAEAEAEPSWKQLIPYIVVRDMGGRILRYRRGKSGGESRLHSKRSIGIGGHINPADGPTWDYKTAMLRELHEEIGQVDVVFEELVAVLNDDTNPVGQVHFGMVHVITVDQPDALIGELDTVVDPEFVDPIELLRQLEEYETWSQLVLEALGRWFLDQREAYLFERNQDAERIEQMLADGDHLPNNCDEDGRP